MAVDTKALVTHRLNILGDKNRIDEVSLSLDRLSSSSACEELIHYTELALNTRLCYTVTSRV